MSVIAVLLHRSGTGAAPNCPPGLRDGSPRRDVDAAEKPALDVEEHPVRLCGSAEPVARLPELSRFDRTPQKPPWVADDLT
jgi:hypothetical protein